MSVRTVLNQTSINLKRTVTFQGTEVFPAATAGYVVGENNTNMLNFDDGSEVDWFYKGYDYIPFGSSQAGTQPV